MSILSVLGDAAKTEAASFLASLEQDDIGKLAIDAVQWAEDNVEGGGAAKLEQATTKLLNDAEALGKNIVAEGEKDANALIELALQAVTAAAAGAIASAI